MGDPTTLLWGLLFGSIGTGFFVYGKKQGSLLPLLCGFVLIVLPWMVSGAWTLFLVALPFLWRS